MRPVRLTRRFRFPAAHVLASRALSDAENQGVFGKCANPNGHGHDYGVEVSVEGARKKISALVDGTYRCVAFSDTVGLEQSLLRLMVTVHKKGDSLEVDLTGSSPNSDTFFNAFTRVASPV